MSDLNGGSTVSNPWMPIKRSPAKSISDTGAEKKTSKGASLGIDLNLTVPPDVIRAVTDLAAAQGALDAKMDAHLAAVEEIMRSIQGAGKANAAAIAEAMTQMQQQTAAMADTIADTMAKLEKAVTTPRKVTLQRDKDGLATGAVSRPIKEET